MTFLTEVPDEDATFIPRERDRPTFLTEIPTDDEEEEKNEVLNILFNEPPSAIELTEREKMLLRIRREGLTRLEFDENNEIKPTLENLRILGIEAEQKKSSLTRADVIQKLQGYRLLTNKLNTSTRRWTRFIDKEDGFLRAGGFPIRNEPNEEFIVMKNVSKRFTFSINRRRVILMEKIPKNAAELISVPAQDLIRDFKGRSGSGVQYVALKNDFTEVQSEENNTALARTISVNRGALGRKFKSNAGKHKEWFLFRLSFSDVRALREQIPLQNAVLQGIPANLQAVIDRYYPERVVIEEKKEDTEEEDEELSDEFDIFGEDDFLRDVLEEVIEEGASLEDEIAEVMVEMLSNPTLDVRIRRLLQEIHPQDTKTQAEGHNLLEILKKIQSGTLLERFEGAFLKQMRDRFRKRVEQEEEDRILDIMIRGEDRGIAPIDNPELADVDLGTIIRLSFLIERDEEKAVEIREDFISELQAARDAGEFDIVDDDEEDDDDEEEEKEETDERGRQLLTPNSLEFWINDTLKSNIGVILDSRGIKELIDEREEEIGRTYVLQSISRSANKLAEKRYLLKLGGKYTKAV